ncbi:MAG: hypothetical protein ACOYLM_13435 [Methylococcaceae bacterium]
MPPGSGYGTALKKLVGKAEFAKLEEVIRTRALDGDMAAAGILINRLVPAFRPRGEVIQFTLPDCSPLEQARAIVAGIAEGAMPPQDGKLLLDGLAAVLKIQEVTDLIPRIEALEGR